MSQPVTEVRPSGPSRLPFLTGAAFSLPYIGIWVLLIYVKLAVLPKLETQYENPMFTILLNAAQLLPLAVASFIYGRRLSHWLTISRSTFIKRTVLMTISFAGYEGLLLIIMFGLGSLFAPQVFHKFPKALFFVAPLAAVFICSIAFAFLHTVSGLVVLLMHPSLKEAPPA